MLYRRLRFGDDLEVLRPVVRARPSIIARERTARRTSASRNATATRSRGRTAYRPSTDLSRNTRSPARQRGRARSSGSRREPSRGRRRRGDQRSPSTTLTGTRRLHEPRERGPRTRRRERTGTGVHLGRRRSRLQDLGARQHLPRDGWRRRPGHRDLHRAIARGRGRDAGAQRSDRRVRRNSMREKTGQPEEKNNGSFPSNRCRSRGPRLHRARGMERGRPGPVAGSDRTRSRRQRRAGRDQRCSSSSRA